jgi:hypothetical protein
MTVDPANGHAFERFCEELTSREGDRAAGDPPEAASCCSVPTDAGRVP